MGISDLQAIVIAERETLAAMAAGHFRNMLAAAMYHSELLFMLRDREMGEDDTRRVCATVLASWLARNG